ncbi:Crp/Fnr family transcriptional regulator [Thermaurantiacus sp.]
MMEGKEIFSRWGWLSQQPPEFRELVLRRAYPRLIPIGGTVYAEGDSPGGVYGIAEGSVAGFARHGVGPLRKLEIVSRGQWFGSGPMITGRRRMLSFQAHEPSLLAHLPLAAIREIEALDAGHARRFAMISEIGNMRLARIACDLAIPDNARRIAAVLLRISGVEEGLDGFYPGGFPITQAALGEMANASRNLVNRALGDLEARGWIKVGYNRVRVIDWQAICSFVNDDE